MYNKLHWIGLIGKAGVGKDHIAQHYLKQHLKPPVLCIGFGDMVKLTGIARGLTTYEHIYEEPRSLERRKILQRLGTEEGRDLYGDDMWIRSLDALVRRLIVGGIELSSIIITDVRFENEANFILQEKKGDLLHIVSSTRSQQREKEESWTQQEREHRSENFNIDQYWDSHPDAQIFTIYNDQDLDTHIDVAQYIYEYQRKRNPKEHND